MEKIIGIKFKHANKTYYFSPNGHVVKRGDMVVVETARGIEMGKVVFEERVLNEKVQWEIKPIIRKANYEDMKKMKDMECDKGKAIRLCQEKIAENNLDMKLIDVEYTLDNSKVIFYFTADGRVDFRELVKSLAAVFKMRIELRQIGVRDEAKMIGGIGSCGRSLCCSSWLNDFQPVSIKMAKTQSLSLNPAKISGICGRLMCCLNYENENYLEATKNMPNPGEEVITPDGKGIVTEVKVLENVVKVKIENAEKDDMSKPVVEIREYQKEDLKRMGRKKCCCNRQDEISEEIKELLKD